MTVHVLPKAHRAQEARVTDQPEDTPLLCDIAEEIQDRVDAYDAGWYTLTGQLSVSIDSLRRWAAVVEAHSLAVEGPAQ